MKRLLKLLGILAVSIPVSLNVVACGGAASSPDGTDVTENPNVQALLVKAKEQISLGLGDLINQYKNLTFEDEFDLGTNITAALNALPANSDSKITDNAIKAIFLNRLQTDINNLLIDKFLVQPPELKSLFGNISPNQILKIDFNQTILTKKMFNWDKNAEFGIANYDPTTYKLTMWHKLTAQLKLILTYKNESNSNSTLEVDNNYSFDYANTGANLRGLIDASTSNVEASLKTFMVELKNTVSSDNDDWNDKARALVVNKINNSKVTINNAGTENVIALAKDDVYASGQYIRQAVTMPTVAAAVTSLNNYLTPVATKFATDVNNWVGSGSTAKKITIDKDNINAFGKFAINDWTISGLTLKPMYLDFLNARTDQTQIQWAEQTATALGTIFCTKGTFAQGRIDLATDGNLTMYINPGDFDDFVKNDKKLSDISNYISVKINAKAKAEHIVKNNIWTKLNGLWSKNPTLSNTNIVEKVDDKTFKIAKGQNGMHGFNYLAISYENTRLLSGNVAYNGNYIIYNNWIIKKAETNVW